MSRDDPPARLVPALAAALAGDSAHAALAAFAAVEAEARAAADGPPGPAQRLARLEALRASLEGEDEGEGEGAPAALRATATGVSHAAHLIEAAEKDVRTSRLHSWSELLAYARYAAAPWGRFAMDLAGEGRAGWPAAEALFCAAELLDRIGSCRADLLARGRVYLPAALLNAHGVDEAALGSPRAAPALRAAFAALGTRADDLIAHAAAATPPLRARRARLAVLSACTRLGRMSRRMARTDPLARPPALGRVERLLSALEARLAERRLARSAARA